MSIPPRSLVVYPISVEISIRRQNICRVIYADRRGK